MATFGDFSSLKRHSPKAGVKGKKGVFQGGVVYGWTAVLSLPPFGFQVQSESDIDHNGECARRGRALQKAIKYFYNQPSPINRGHVGGRVVTGFGHTMLWVVSLCTRSIPSGGTVGASRFFVLLCIRI